MARNRKLSRRERDEIVQAYAGGESAPKIGRRYDIPDSYVRVLYQRAKFAGQQPIHQRPKPKGKTPKPIPAVVSPQQIGSGRQGSTGYTKLM